jgi:hypothetical protein
MSKPVASGARLITVGVALAVVSASLLVVSANALDSIVVDRAELDDDLLRVEGEGAVPDAIVWVTSAESSASSPADDDGRFRLLAPNFQSSNCQVTVTDGATSARVSLDECTPTAPPTTPPPTTAPPTTTTTTTTEPTTTTTTEPPTTTTTTTTQPTTTTTASTTSTTTTLPPTTTTTTVPPTTTTTTLPPTTTTTVPPTPVTFTDLHDLVPGRCFSAALSTVDVAVCIGIESGFNPTNFTNNACVASTTAFNTRTVGDTFTATVTAQPGRHITRVHYQQSGSRILSRSLYWQASGTGQLTANGVSVPFSFTLPTLTRTIDLTGQNVESTTISVSISMSAGRSTNQPRVTDPPGSATISVSSAVISVESD